jgi:two-component system LytT family response regulator
MDIKLGSENSFEIINHFNDQKLNVIFVTSYQEFAFNAFKVNAIDYILKPVNETDIVAAINKFQKSESLSKNNEKSKDKLLVYKTDRLYPIEINKIVKLKSENQYTSIYTIDNQKVISSKPLLHFETELDETKFVRVHHSYIVNLDYIKNIKTGLNPSVLLTNDEIIPISRRKKKELLNKFST